MGSASGSTEIDEYFDVVGAVHFGAFEDRGGLLHEKRAEQEQRPRLTAADNGQPDG